MQVAGYVVFDVQALSFGAGASAEEAIEDYNNHASPESVKATRGNLLKSAQATNDTDIVVALATAGLVEHVRNHDPLAFYFYGGTSDLGDLCCTEWEYDEELTPDYPLLVEPAGPPKVVCDCCGVSPLSAPGEYTGEILVRVRQDPEFGGPGQGERFYLCVSCQIRYLGARASEYFGVVDAPDFEEWAINK